MAEIRECALWDNLPMVKSLFHGTGNRIGSAGKPARFTSRGAGRFLRELFWSDHVVSYVVREKVAGINDF